MSLAEPVEHDNERFNDDITRFFDFLRGPEDLMDFARWRRERSLSESVPVKMEAFRSPVQFVVNTVDPSKAPVAVMLEGQSTIFTYGKSPFYNESVWFNEGIKEALYMGAEWVVLMSDDLYEITPIQKLTEALARIDNQQFDAVWIDPSPDYYHSYWGYVAVKHPLENILGRDHRKLAKLCEKFKVDVVIGSEKPIRKPLHYWAFSKAFPRPRVGPVFKMTSDFAILSAEWCRRQGPEVLSELFCGWEDMDLSMRLRDARSTAIDFRIGSQIGGTLGVGMNKALGELYNLSILNSLLREGRYR